MHTIGTITEATVTRRADGTGKATFRSRLLSVVAMVERLAARRRSRLALLSLTDDQLKDIGISRADAYREGIRSAWE
jgi:uncharacterized protein YjiS (DUF1127 family)